MHQDPDPEAASPAPAVTVAVVRSGGIAGTTRRWGVEAEASDADEWIDLIDACPWDDEDADDEVAYAREGDVPRGADRFAYRVSARMPEGPERHAALSESQASGPWRALIDAVRAASPR